MQRHPSIVPLSRVHHFGLLCAWKIRQGLQKNVSSERIGKYLQYFFEQHLLPHFKEEERWLYTQWKHPLGKQAIEEHAHLISLANQMIPNATEELLLKFADALQMHIRFEERTVFPELENTLTQMQLEKIGVLIQNAHQEIKPDVYADEFWING